MNKTLAAILALALPTTLAATACGTVESPDDLQDTQPVPPDDMPDEPDPEEPPTPKPQAGTVDTAFGTNGYLPLASVLGYPADAAVQGDKLVVCSNATIDGAPRVVVQRVGFDGALDMTFGIEDGRFAVFGDNSYCNGIVVRLDGTIDVFVRVQGGAAGIFALDADGTTFDPVATGSSLRAMNLTSSNQLLAAAATPTGFSSRDAEAPLDIATISGLTGSPTQPFNFDGHHAIAGVFTSGGTTGWTLVVQRFAPPDVEGWFDMPVQFISVGGAATEFMHDAVALPDHSVIAVGSADADLDAMVGRLYPTDDNVFVHQVRDIGLTSTFRHVILDGENHVLAFGSTSMNGASQILYQRIDTATLAVDPAYAGNGTMTVPAYQGSGDISTVVRHNGGLYALTAYNVETGTPGAALLKIHE